MGRQQQQRQLRNNNEVIYLRFTFVLLLPLDSRLVSIVRARDCDYRQSSTIANPTPLSIFSSA